MRSNRDSSLDHAGVGGHDRGIRSGGRLFCAKIAAPHNKQTERKEKQSGTLLLGQSFAAVFFFSSPFLPVCALHKQESSRIRDTARTVTTIRSTLRGRPRSSHAVLLLITGMFFLFQSLDWQASLQLPEANVLHRHRRSGQPGERARTRMNSEGGIRLQQGDQADILSRHGRCCSVMCLELFV